MKDSLRSHQVCSLTGISYRQLDYWDRAGLLTPSVQEARGSGTQRRYSPSDVRRVLVVKQLMAAGSPNWPTRLRKLLGQIPREMPEHRWLVVGAEDGAGFATDDSLPRACVKYGPGCMVIDLQPVVPDQEKKAS